MEYCRVIVDGAPFVNEDGFTYRVPPFLEQFVAIGSIVYVPFGKGDKLKIGFVVSEESAVETAAAHKIKDIVMVNHLSPVVTPELMALCRFVADSYACALIYALRQVVPKYMLHHAFVAFEEIESGKRTALNRRSIKDGAAGCAMGTLRLVPHEPTAEPGERFWQLTSEESATIEAWMIALKRAPKQKAVLQFILQQGIVDGERLNEAFDGCQPTLRTLREKGYIRECARPAAKATDEYALTPELVMTERQQAVFDALRTQLDAHAYHKSLINGVTGSGKTLIYEKLTETVIAHRRQALILVPEIALSQQLFERLQKRFGARIALLHSQLTERERYEIWLATQAHEIDIVLGPRSALFLPFADLGLVIIDEEHESSYKQSEPDPRYHAIRVAEYLAQKNQALLLLGSATPSVDTLYEVVQKKCSIYNLPDRIGQAALPEMRLVDMTEERRQGNHGILSQALREAMAASLSRGEQVILLINRKGYSSSIVCHECGEVIRCPRCDIPLTYYQSTGELKCNYCEYHLPMVSACPSCGSSFIDKRGTGTESVEEECARLFPKAVVARLDAQALANKASRDRVLQDYADRRTNILVGTQLLAKGLDFINTTCIGVIHADLTLNLPDFRSAERCFQLMVQVAGRAGRDNKPSTVFIQTYQKDHYAFADACQQNVHQFFLDEMAFRKQWLYPPVVRLCRVIVSDFDANDVEKSMRSIYNYIVRLPIRKEVIGPSYAPLAKKNNRYRMHLIVKTTEEEDVQSLLRQFRSDLQSMHLKNSTRVLIDIDPENIF